MLRSDFNFDLPASLIANYPSEQRTQCRMLCLDGNTGKTQDKIFIDLKEFLQEGDLLVFNDTKVIPARLYGHKESGGKVELLIERITSKTTALSHIKASKSPKADSFIILDDNTKLKVTGRDGQLFMIETLDDLDLLDLLERMVIFLYLHILKERMRSQIKSAIRLYTQRFQVLLQLLLQVFILIMHKLKI